MDAAGAVDAAGAEVVVTDLSLEARSDAARSEVERRKRFEEKYLSDGCTYEHWRIGGMAADVRSYENLLKQIAHARKKWMHYSRSVMKGRKMGTADMVAGLIEDPKIRFTFTLMCTAKQYNTLAGNFTKEIPGDSREYWLASTRLAGYAFVWSKKPDEVLAQAREGW